MKAMITVTHLLGTGHLSRALTLARAFVAAGDDVLLVSGGFPAPQLDLSGIGLLQLPPLRSDGTDFSRLLDAHGGRADAALFDARRAALVAALDRMRPDILITELFPFGRRSLATEFTALLDAAQVLPRRPVILSSIRDIPAPPSKPEKATRAAALIAGCYDAVLVHSDPTVSRLDASWPVTPALERRLRYTGYVAPPPPEPHPERAGAGEILVSAGGGAVGDPVFRAALGAASATPGSRWRLLVGGDAARRIAALRADAPANVVLEPARPDFRQMLHHAAASVSLCGYNTAMDVLQTGVPAVLVPFDAGNEVEQGLRARSLAPLPGIAVLKTAYLTADSLARSVADVITQGRRPGQRVDFDGALHSVTIAHAMAEART
ncbi:glycosyltransferase family protein [Pukyongiella litopenaei]|uniref:Glycosyltransferase n=1 Tax=Pukyongiella litopenaei TaxID=2605946 RepID=A0A2S0MP40_9RHOB|nr:glycosyltransferase [Pukyongiella litopenaei]AVO37662.1 glycosyltransferase [Pukyongiella litopenaei]